MTRDRRRFPRPLSSVVRGISLACGLAFATDAEAQVCGADVDCPGDAVCEMGTCSTPGAPAAPEPPVPVAPPGAAQEPPGLPAPPPSQPGPDDRNERTAREPAEPAARCLRDRDCPDGLVCRAFACVDAPTRASTLRGSDADPSPAFVLGIDVRLHQLLVPDAESAGTAVETAVYVGLPAIGVSAGYSNLAGISGFVAGLEFLRHIEGIHLFGTDATWVGTLVTPTIDARFHAHGANSGAVYGVTWTSDLTGLRFEKSLGGAAFRATLRGPTVGPGLLFVKDDQFRDDEDPRFTFTLGSSLDVGFAL